MKKPPLHISQFNEKSLLIQWPMEVSEDILGYVSAMSKAILTSFNDVICTPTYASLLVVFKGEMPSFETIKTQLEQLYHGLNSTTFVGNHFEIPVCYDAEFALDKMALEESLQLDFEEIIKRHSQAVYKIYGIGFLPGFMYLGGLDLSLETPRKAVPRMKVPKGAVGIAGKQTGVYPQESPGGWQIIGNCPIDFFNMEKEFPFFVAVGDTISFVPISIDQYKLLKIEQEIGIYKPKKR